MNQEYLQAKTRKIRNGEVLKSGMILFTCDFSQIFLLLQRLEIQEEIGEMPHGEYEIWETLSCYEGGRLHHFLTQEISTSGYSESDEFTWKVLKTDK